jgi:hypothetical protein
MDRLDRVARDVDNGLLERREHQVLFGLRKEPAYHRLDLGACEVDTNVRWHRLVRASLREPTDLANERVAKIFVLATATLHEVARPRPGIRVGIASTEVAPDLVGDSWGPADHPRQLRIPQCNLTLNALLIVVGFAAQRVWIP